MYEQWNAHFELIFKVIDYSIILIVLSYIDMHHNLFIFYRRYSKAKEEDLSPGRAATFPTSNNRVPRITRS